MASPLFRFITVPIVDIRPYRIFDVAGDGKLAICPMKIFDGTLIPDEVVVVGIDFEVHVYDRDQIVRVLAKTK